MTDPQTPTTPNSGRSLARDVAVIVLLGAALGVASNQMQHVAGSSRALAWIKAPRTIARLEDLPPAPSARDSAVAATPASPALAPSRRAPSAPEPSVAPAAARSAPVTPAPTTPAPVPANPGPTSAPLPAAPAIPDTREPLEAGYATVKALLEAQAAVLVDARSAEEYAEEHIPGAINLPFDDVFQKPELAAGIDARGRVLVTYCGGGDCELSKSLAFALIEAGHKKVLVFMAGLPGWKDAGNPVTRGPRP